MIAILTVALTLTSACGSVEAQESVAEEAGAVDSLPQEPEATTGFARLEHAGTSIEVPAGWDGRLLFLEPDGASALLQVANFELGEQDGFGPPPELPPGEEDPIKAMSGADVLITLAATSFGEAEVGPVSIGASDLLPPGPKIPRGHALAERSFCLQERCFDLTVDFASSPPDPAVIEDVNTVLSTLRVAASDVSPVETTTTAQAEESTRWIEYRSDDYRFSVRYPSDWYRADEPLTPNLLDPKEILSLGTYQLRPGGDRCSHFPVRALEDLGPTDAFISIQERDDPPAGRYPPRPRPFELPADPPSSEAGRFCVTDAPRFEDWVPFSDGERAFYLIVTLGQEISEETRRQTAEILESVRFDS